MALLLWWLGPIPSHVTADGAPAMAAAFRSAARALPPHQSLPQERLFSSRAFHVLLRSGRRIMYQQREGELWPWVMATGVEEMPSLCPAGTVSRLPLP